MTDEASLDPRNLIVNYIPTPVTDTVLRNLFAPFGEIETARVIVDKNTGHPKGYGFVKFTSVEAALLAMEKMNGFELQNKRLKVTTARGPTASVGNPAFGGSSTTSYAHPAPQAPVHAMQPQNQAHPQAPQPQQLPNHSMFPQPYMMPSVMPQPMMMPYQPTLGYVWLDPTTGRPIMPMGMPMMGMAPPMGMGMPPTAMGMMPNPGFGAPMLGQPDGQLPNFPQQQHHQQVMDATKPKPDEILGRNSMNMTLMGVSGNFSPNNSVDAKAGQPGQPIR